MKTGYLIRSEEGIKSPISARREELSVMHQCKRYVLSDVCQLPRADGNCGEAIPSWFFDAVSGRCLEFFYTGCGGNLNRFASFEHCRQRCQPTVETTTTAVVPTCHLPRDTGPCNTHVILWYFNPQAQRCEQFYYGGCGGNSNRFNSRELCEHSCIGRKSSQHSSNFSFMMVYRIYRNKYHQSFIPQNIIYKAYF
ncbi:PAPLN [Cordylochernes scorpioides]|uniref:PAPLN n=1 Tax=Cordylochernes scorpioides TaxID=51811 RepID=A0ABY6KEY9_9ARAC|nr:PAPLN [Cordylochernes scorpioides]